jgi:hypothetical protein
MAPPSFVITNSATPWSEVQTPFAVNEGGGGGGGTQAVISTVVVNEASLVLENVYPVEEPVTCNVMLCPASREIVPVCTTTPFASVIV